MIPNRLTRAEPAAQHPALRLVRLRAPTAEPALAVGPAPTRREHSAGCPLAARDRSRSRPPRGSSRESAVRANLGVQQPALRQFRAAALIVGRRNVGLTPARWEQLAGGPLPALDRSRSLPPWGSSRKAVGENLGRPSLRSFRTAVLFAGEPSAASGPCARRAARWLAGCPREVLRRLSSRTG